tara:strand:+ start:1342 stop:1830 length:489 start_codon:yes stop_codon:yes gene_type:complete
MSIRWKQKLLIASVTLLMLGCHVEPITRSMCPIYFSINPPDAIIQAELQHLIQDCHVSKTHSPYQFILTFQKQSEATQQFHLNEKSYRIQSQTLKVQLFDPKHVLIWTTPLFTARRVVWFEHGRPIQTNLNTHVINQQLKHELLQQFKWALIHHYQKSSIQH